VLHLARLTVNAEMVAQTHAPALKWAALYEPAARAFLQACRRRAAMQTLVVEGVGNSRRVADLFAAAALHVPAGQDAAVSAFEADIDAVSALKEPRNTRTAEIDHGRAPRSLPPAPMNMELEAFDAVVLDPPCRRQGAVRTPGAGESETGGNGVVQSCNICPRRRTLIDGGYKCTA